jgi:hypothetical protein
VLATLASSESPPMACRWLPSLCVLPRSSLYASVSKSLIIMPLRLLSHLLSHSDWLILKTSFYLNQLFKGYLSKCSHSEESQVRPSAYRARGHKSAYTTPTSDPQIHVFLM